jgi:hypothetical protein
MGGLEMKMIAATVLSITLVIVATPSLAAKKPAILLQDGASRKAATERHVSKLREWPLVRLQERTWLLAGGLGQLPANKAKGAASVGGLFHLAARPRGAVKSAPHQHTLDQYTVASATGRAAPYEPYIAGGTKGKSYVGGSKALEIHFFVSSRL